MNQHTLPMQRIQPGRVQDACGSIHHAKPGASFYPKPRSPHEDHPAEISKGLRSEGAATAAPCTARCQPHTTCRSPSD
eukprot:365483-Chlamydomonas_euryale.AAC.1